MSLVSCESWLALEPENNLIREEFWQTEADIESAVIAGYTALQGGVDEFFYWGELRGGNFIAGSSPVTAHVNIMNLEITETNALAEWSFAYTAINVANEVIYYAPGVVDVDPSLSTARMYTLQSEAYFQRALAYFYLVRTFKDVPYVTTPTFDDTVDFYVSQTDGLEILAAEVQCLADIVAYAPTSYDTTAESKGRATKGAIYALMADIYLWLEQPDECIAACEALTALNQYTLVAASLWFDIFSLGNSNESIFELDFNISLGTSNPIVAPLLQTSGKSLSVNTTFINEFDDVDIRGEGATYLLYGDLVYEPWKQVGLSNDISDTSLVNQRRVVGSTNDNGYIFYRLADVKFMEAEARAMIGEYDEAKSLISEVVSRATSGYYTDTIGDDETSILTEILAQRKKEFAFEGKYWFDVLRIAKRNDFSNKTILVDIVTATALSVDKVRLAAVLEDNNSLYMPVYYSELEANSALVQNSFYQ